MKVEVKDVSAVEKQVEVEIPPERVADEIEEQYGELSQKAAVKGFRPGKVPRKILERIFKDYISEQVVKKLVEETLETALDRKQLKPVVQPVVDPAELKPGEAYSYTAHVEVKPPVVLNEYQGLVVGHRDEQVSEAHVEDALQNIRESAATIRDPEPPRPVRAGDQVTAEILIREGETELYKNPDETIESWRPSWIPGLIDRLEGKEAGGQAEFSAEVGADEGVPEKFRGKNLSFAISIKGVKERIVPELTDEFAREFTREESAAALRDAVRKNLEETTRDRNRGRLEQSLVRALVEKNPVEVPPTLVKAQALDLAKGFMRQSFRRMPSDTEAERFRDIFLEEAKFMFQANYLLEEIAAREQVEVSDEEFEETVKKEAERAGLHPDKLKGRLDDAAREALRTRARLDKTLDFLLSKATIKEEEEAPREAASEAK